MASVASVGFTSAHDRRFRPLRAKANIEVWLLMVLIGCTRKWNLLALHRFRKLLKRAVLTEPHCGVTSMEM